ncbi:MAG: hypothetical protein JXR76_32335 [Deltaproteobacteria bacterium]|nr:hypothetical protein [Deltaproteobacteria bacterium]
MIPVSIKSMLESLLDSEGPVDVLLQARDIFEMVLMAESTTRVLPELTFSSHSEKKWIQTILKQNDICDDLSFKTLLGCADLLLNSITDESTIQVKGIFKILLKNLSCKAATSQ